MWATSPCCRRPCLLTVWDVLLLRLSRWSTRWSNRWRLLRLNLRLRICNGGYLHVDSWWWEAGGKMIISGGTSHLPRKLLSSLVWSCPASWEKWVRDGYVVLSRWGRSDIWHLLSPSLPYPSPPASCLLLVRAEYEKATVITRRETLTFLFASAASACKVTHV